MSSFVDLFHCNFIKVEDFNGFNFRLIRLLRRCIGLIVRAQINLTVILRGSFWNRTER